MNKTQVRLSREEFGNLNTKFPRSRGSADIGKRAVAIVRMHLRKTSPGCKFLKHPPPGTDVAVRLSGERRPKLIEVKGTSSSAVAWPQLKVSGRPSHDLLVTGRATLFRVINVYARRPLIVELAHGDDFKLVEEPRWRLTPKRGA